MTSGGGERLYLFGGHHHGDLIREVYPTMELKSVAAAVTWTAVVALAIARTATNQQALTVWCFVLGQVAVLITGWLIVEGLFERMQAESLAEFRAMDERAVEKVAVQVADSLRGEAKVSSLR